MASIYIDQSAGKRDVISLLSEIREVCQVERDPDKLSETTDPMLAQIKVIASGWNVDPEKLMSLVTSQVHSGNVAGAIKLIKSAIPDRRLKLLPAIIGGFLLWPFRFIGRVLSLGFKR